MSEFDYDQIFRSSDAEDTDAEIFRLTDENCLRMIVDEDEEDVAKVPSLAGTNSGCITSPTKSPKEAAPIPIAAHDALSVASSSTRGPFAADTPPHPTAPVPPGECDDALQLRQSSPPQPSAPSPSSSSASRTLPHYPFQEAGPPPYGVAAKSSAAVPSFPRGVVGPSKPYAVVAPGGQVVAATSFATPSRAPPAVLVQPQPQGMVTALVQVRTPDGGSAYQWAVLPAAAAAAHGAAQYIQQPEPQQLLQQQQQQQSPQLMQYVWQQQQQQQQLLQQQQIPQFMAPQYNTGAPQRYAMVSANGQQQVVMAMTMEQLQQLQLQQQFQQQQQQQQQQLRPMYFTGQPQQQPMFAPTTMIAPGVPSGYRFV